jgi:DNA-binding NarL/FixJ family response regulator
MIRVLIADDEALIRAGLRALLDMEPDITVVGEAADGREAVTRARATLPDVVLMDIQMPEVDGIEATRQISADHRLADARVVIASSFPFEHYVLESLRAGASGYLVKDMAPDDLVRAVRVAAAGGSPLSPCVSGHLIAEVRARPAEEEPFDPELVALLTPREREVMALVASGLSNQEVAERLYITPATVKTHVGRLLSKVGMRNRAQLVTLAYETGLATPVRAKRTS